MFSVLTGGRVSRESTTLDSLAYGLLGSACLAEAGDRPVLPPPNLTLPQPEQAPSNTGQHTPQGFSLVTFVTLFASLEMAPW